MFLDTNSVKDWIESIKARSKINVRKIDFASLEKWYFSNDGYRISHETGRFFSIEGLRIETDYGKINRWDQPIINQPETGILGIITKKIGKELYFLLQAKIEPGNINYVQLSPTLQATKSNYSKVHLGRTPKLFEYFRGFNADDCIVDQLQSEQGSRFLKKRNRNILLLTKEDIQIDDDFLWLTYDQIVQLMRLNNFVNMDTRTVLSCIPLGHPLLAQENKKAFSQYYGSSVKDARKLNTILHKLSNYKSSYYFKIKKIPLTDMEGWHISEKEIIRRDNKHFKVIATSVEIENREVSKWTQPMIESTQCGLFAVMIKNTDGIIHFLVRVKFEIGNFDHFELGPTVQCSPDNYERGEDLLLDYVLSANKEQIIFNSFQSEEGGRFYKEENKYMIVKVENDFGMNLTDEYEWLTLAQIKELIKFNNYVNVQLRSLISMIDYNIVI